MTVFTIPAGVPFVDTLARKLLRQAQNEAPLKLASTTVFLPTRRACRALRDAFLRHSEGKSTLLPRILPVGDVEEDLLVLSSADVMSVHPSIHPLHRQMMLARLTMAAQKSLSHGAGLSWDQAIRLAKTLGEFLDEAHTENADFQQLQNLVPQDYAAHWQLTLDFLKIVTETWPAVIQEKGLLDPAQRRNQLLHLQARFWHAHPPTAPVIAAGITGTIPAVGDLLAVIARLPTGSILLPGLDLALEESIWQSLDEQHPQYGLSQLLKRLEINRSDVRPWVPESLPQDPSRQNILREAFKPSAYFTAFSSDEKYKKEFSSAPLTQGDKKILAFQRLQTTSEQEEALAIAAMMRLDLEAPGQTTALVTPDRQLAERVTKTLSRWNIQVDDSAGKPLLQTPPAIFFSLLLEWAQNPHDLVTWMALLKHPLAAGGLSPAAFRHGARLLERQVLRNNPPSFAGSDPLAKLQARVEQENLAPLKTFMACISEPLGSWVNAFTSGQTRPLQDWISGHLEVAENLATSHEESGADRLWRHEDGEILARTFAVLKDSAVDFPAVSGSEYTGLFHALLEGIVVRPRYGRHPRAFILGPLEARLQHFDHVILGGLNDSVWPEAAPSDPWLSRPMRKKFGLPSPEYRIGLAAHDFYMLASGPRVTLTRSQRRQRAPTVPSRWLLRLETILKKLGYETWGEDAFSLSWIHLLDQPEGLFPLPPPAPTPPVIKRPRILSVTDVERWMRDPYSIYAKHILKLAPLDPLSPDFTAAERGQFIHTALERFVRAYPEILPSDSYAQLLSCGRQAFGEGLAQPEVWAFWWPRFEKIAAWFIAWEKERRLTCRFLASECTGHLLFQGPEGPFKLTAKADRLDLGPDSTLCLVDYKTGQVPKTSDVALGFSPQLPLEGAIAQAGHFAGVPARPVNRLEYIALSGRDNQPGQASYVPDPTTRIAEALQGLKELVALFDNPATPYLARLRPQHSLRYNDYEHLARVQEWAVMDN